ncbi:MAG: hypothetical protein ACR2QV_00730 [Gammaproteobacteria bacterium]
MNTKRWITGLLHGLLLICSTPVVLADGPLELVTHDSDVYGIRAVQDGDYEKGIEQLKGQLGHARMAHGKRTPVLIDLCVAYTMVRDFEAADEYCNQAVDAGWYQGLALNNRGVMKMAQGDYEDAIADFQAATETRGATAVSKRNLARAQQTLAARRDEPGNRYALADMTATASAQE